MRGIVELSFSVEPERHVNGLGARQIVAKLPSLAKTQPSRVDASDPMAGAFEEPETRATYLTSPPPTESVRLATACAKTSSWVTSTTAPG
jgi:hypothetical protein